MKHLFLVLLLLIFLGDAAFGQPSSIRFVPMVGAAKWKSGETNYPINSGADSFNVQTFRFYISHIAFYQNNQLVWAEKNSYHLMDLENDQLSIALNAPEHLTYNQLWFNLGIDSATNTSGAMGGELDATKGMYWAWQSGYINFKMEGMSMLCPKRKHAFAFHLGGFTNGNYCMQRLSFPISKTGSIYIATDLAAFINSIDLRIQNTVMEPGADANALSRKAAGMFKIFVPK